MGYAVQKTGQYQTWVPTFTGFSADPTVSNARYSINGKQCHCYVFFTSGTSNASTFTMTLPAVCALVEVCSAITIEGATVAAGWARTRAASNIIDCFRTPGTTTWATSGNKNIYFEITFEIE